MQIALVAVVLLAGMWFTVLRPKSDDGGGSSTPAPAAATPASKAAPGVKGLTRAVDKAKGAAATSDAANAKVQAATGGTTAAGKSTAAKAAPVKKLKSAKPVAAAKKPAAPAVATDPSTKLLAQLAHGKVVVVLFHGSGADDRAAKKAVERLAASDKKVVVSQPSISKVGRYAAITRGVEVMVAPTIVVIGKDRKARVVTGYTDVDVLRQTVGDARRTAKK
jgi:hypothetical protein